MMPRTGLFITFEGVEGSGKSTQIRRLAAALRRRGVRVLVTREPGGTPVAEQVRRLLLARGRHWPAISELLLVNAARAAHLEEIVRPALRRGTWVLCDRFTDATVAYQGHGRGLPLVAVRAVNRLATGGLQPDRTLLLDLPAGRGLRRARQRKIGASRFEDEAEGFHRRVRAGYRSIARREAGRVRRVLADGARGAVAARVWSAIEDLLPRQRRARKQR
jgi:dTMP kinase